MTNVLRNDNIDLVVSGWIKPRRDLDLDAIERALHPDAVWQSLQPGVACTGRTEVIDHVRSSDGWHINLTGIELQSAGDLVMLGLHSADLTSMAGVRIDGQVYVVFTIADGVIVRIHECRTREEALVLLGPG